MSPALSRPASVELHSRLREKLDREMGGLITGCLHDRETVEVMLNSDGVLWVERSGRPMQRLGLMRAEQAEAFISTVAAIRGRAVTESSPILECELPWYGSRFEALLPPVVLAPVFAIRCHPDAVLTLDDYVHDGVMTEPQMALIAQAVEARRNIIVAGGTGSGKTTLVNAIIRHMSAACPDDRLLILEDTPEIRCVSPNAVILRTSPHADHNLLVRASLRLRPDRIIIGEVRGAEALELLKAWNTGHPGDAATIHANDAHGALIRLENLLAEATPAPMQKTIAAAANLVVVIGRHNGGRRVREIIAVHGYENGTYLTSTLENAA